MITKDGYSKDPNLVPEAIVVTIGKELLEELGGPLTAIKQFEEVMADSPENWWLHKSKNKPQYDIAHVYVICMGRLYCRCYYGGYESGETTLYNADGSTRVIDWPRIILAGPMEKPPFKRNLKGFQGFRYATTLF